MSKKSNNWIHLHRFLNTLADSALIAFVPILIYVNTGSLLLSVAILAIEFATQLILNSFFKSFFVRFGFVSLVLHIFLIIASQTAIVFFDNTLLVVLVAGFLAGVSRAFYYAPLYICFALSDKDISVVKFETAEALGKACIIVFSAYLLGSEVTRNFYFALGFATFLYLISLIPLASYVKPLKKHIKTQSMPLWQCIMQNKRRSFYHFFLGINHAVIKFMVPLYIFEAHFSIQVVGLVLAAAELSRIIAALIAKHLGIAGKRNHVIFIVTFISAISCIGVIISQSGVFDYVLTTLLVFTSSMLFVATFRGFLWRMTGDGSLFSGVCMREVQIALGKCFIVLLFMAVPVFTLVFIIGAVNNLGIFATQYRKKQK